MPLPALDRVKWLQNAVACVGNARVLTVAGEDKDKLGRVLLSLAAMYKAAMAEQEQPRVEKPAERGSDDEVKLAIVLDGEVAGWCIQSAISDVIREEPKAAFRPISDKEIEEMEGEQEHGKKSPGKRKGKKARTGADSGSEGSTGVSGEDQEIS